MNDDEGNLIQLSSFQNEQILVCYFYPKDHTPGCTLEACEFRNEWQGFEKYNVKVFGISADGEKSHQRFKAKHKLPFSLLSDKNHVAEKAFGVPRNLFGLLPGRVTFVIDKQGVIQHVFDSALHATRHPHEALKIIRTL